MAEHITKVDVKITERQPDEFCDDNWSISINGTTTGVSSGSAWGGSSSVKGTYTDALEKAKEKIEEHNIWCDSWRDTETDTVHRKGETYKTQMMVNGEKVTFATGVKTLTSFFGGSNEEMVEAQGFGEISPVSIAKARSIPSA